MPIHIVVAHLVVVLAPMAAVIAGVYAVAPQARRVIRWPVVTVAVATAAPSVWAGEAGGDLLGARIASVLLALVAVAVVSTTVTTVVAALKLSGRTGPRQGAEQ